MAQFPAHAGAATQAQSRQTFFVDHERIKAAGQKGPAALHFGTKPELPAGHVHWVPHETRGQAKQNGTKEFPLSSMRRQGHSDPLDLKEPPRRGGDPRQQHMGADVNYLAAGVNPDSLCADVEALLMQERMLAEQTEWWQDRAERELKVRRELQAEIKTQEGSFKQEILDMQKAIANARQQHRDEEDRLQATMREASELRAQAAEAKEEAEVLRRRLEQVASSASAGNASRIRTSIASARASLAGRPMNNQAILSPTTRISPPRSVGQSPLSPRFPDPSRPDASLASASPNRATPGVAMFDAEDFDDEPDVLSNPGGMFGGSIGPNTNLNAAAAGLIDMGFQEDDEDDDDDLDMAGLGFG